MSARKEEYSLPYSFLPGLLLTGLMWLITILAHVYNYDIGRFGLYPGKLKGLIGVISTPFLHKDFVHLLSNTFPFLILSAMIFYSYRKISGWVLAGSFVLTGLATWLLARPAYHIGASGVVYAMASFLLFSGIFRRDRASGAISFAIMFLYSSMLYGVFPSDDKISWESHALGGITGLLLAFVFRDVNRPVKEAIPEEDEPDFEAQLLAWQQQQHNNNNNRLYKIGRQAKRRRLCRISLRKLHPTGSRNQSVPALPFRPAPPAAFCTATFTSPKPNLASQKISPEKPKNKRLPRKPGQPFIREKYFGEVFISAVLPPVAEKSDKAPAFIFITCSYSVRPMNTRMQFPQQGKHKPQPIFCGPFSGRRKNRR